MLVNKRLSKRHFHAQNSVIWRIKRNNRSNGLACRRVLEPKKCSKFRTGGVYISPIWGAKTPKWIEPNCSGGRGPRRNHAVQIWWRSVQGFLVGWESILPFPIDFEDRPCNIHTIVRGVMFDTKSKIKCSWMSRHVACSTLWGGSLFLASFINSQYFLCSLFLRTENCR